MPLLAAFALTLALGAPPPQDPPAADSTPTTQLRDVVVEGRALEVMVREFVNEVSAPANNRGLARWNRPICVGAVNLRPEAAQYVVDRVSDVARDLEVEASEPGCRPNILIVATVGGAALASALVEDRPRNFDLRHNGTDAGTRAFENFRTSERPVRWWQISMPVDADTGARAVRLPGDIDPSTGRPSAPTIRVFAASRLRTQIRDDMIRTIVIIDVDRLAGANLIQLADYVTMVSLAQVDPEADISGYDTVLNLFDDPATGPDGLTEWDMSYLESLYQHDQLRINRNSQVSSVADGVIRARRQAAAAETGEPDPEP